MVAIPLSSASCFVSRTVTGNPALRKFMAMPPPMVPAPMTATLAILRAGVFSGTSGIFAAARSAKKAWRSARDSGVCTSCMKSSRSNLRPSSKGIVMAAATASMHLSGAGKFFASGPTLFRANWKNASAFGKSIFTSRKHASGLRSATTLRANASAPGSNSFSNNVPSMISSMSLVPLNCSDDTGAPETIMFSAASTPIARGRRCVPPAPGRSPSFTSGSAILAPGDATRKWHPNASSSPPPIQMPPIRSQRRT